jgi:hypothetical protein
MALPLISIAWSFGARAFLVKVLGWLAVSFVVRAIIGMGASYVAFSWLAEWVAGYLAVIAGAVPTGMQVGLDLLALGGFGVAINMALSSMVGGAAIWVAVNSMRILLSAAGVAGALNKARSIV